MQHCSRSHGQARLNGRLSCSTGPASWQPRHATRPSTLSRTSARSGPRITKDRALRAIGAERARLALEAAAQYEAVYRAFGRYYPCVNAATMYLLAGNMARADELATEALALTDDIGPVATAGRDDQYWSAASTIEAALVLGDTPRAWRALQRAAQCRPIDLSARAATRRQLRLICDTRGVSMQGSSTPSHLPVSCTTAATGWVPLTIPSASPKRMNRASPPRSRVPSTTPRPVSATDHSRAAPTSLPPRRSSSVAPNSTCFYPSRPRSSFRFPCVPAAKNGSLASIVAWRRRARSRRRRSIL